MNTWRYKRSSKFKEVNAMLERDGKDRYEFWHEPDHKGMHMACKVALILTHGPWAATEKSYLEHER